MTTYMRRRCGVLAAAVVLASLAGCSRVTEFDRPLELPDFRDAGTDVTFACQSEQDCTALGACVICESNVCVKAPEADQDGDGHENALCRGATTGDDCDDTDPLVHPEAQERCNGSDDDCDTIVDEGDAFGLSWTLRQSAGRAPSPSPTAGRTGLAWVEGAAPCPTVMSAFLDASGVIRYPAILSGCAEDAFLAPRSTPAGYVAVFVDRTEGGADIHLRFLDTLAQPDPTAPDPVNVSSDFEESDMPVIAWAGSSFHYGVAWLSHDTDDRGLIRVLFTTISPTGNALLAEPLVPGEDQFRLTTGSETGFGERVELVYVDDDSFRGFGLAWVEQSGMWFATVVTSEDGTVIDTMQTHDISTDVDTGGALFPSLTWARDRFVLAYAWDDPSTLKASPDVKLLQITGHDTGTLVASPIAMEREFPREATTPALVWHPDIQELGLAWADGREGYGIREVRFARLKLVDGTSGTSVVPVLEDLILTDPEAYAGSIRLAVEPGAGFVAAWTERQGDELGFEVGYLECRQ